MKRSWIYALIALALVASAALVACGGSEDNKATPTVGQNQQQDEATPTAKATTSSKTTPSGSTTPSTAGTAKATAKATASSGGSGASLGDVPVYPGASEVSTGEWSGSQAMIPVIGSDVDAGNFSTVKYGIYETSDAANDVFDWYKGQMGDWKQEYTYSGSSGGQTAAMAVWTKNDGKEAAWLMVGEDSGTTSISIFFGS